jgi:hypothetical protein
MRLNQLLAVIKNTKQRVNEILSKLYKTVQHTSLFEGAYKTYRPSEEGGEVFPPENKRVQCKAHELVNETLGYLRELMDTTLSVDVGNNTAKADIVINGQAVLKDVPAVTMLALEKNLTDLHTFVAALPTLDPAEEWTWDAQQSLHRTGKTSTVRTKKVQKPLVLYPATDKHPAQTQLVVEDITIGYWDQVRTSGALPVPEKMALLARIEEAQKAVKFAREQANEATVTELTSKPLFDWIGAKQN